MLNTLSNRYHIPCLIFKTALIINTNAETILTFGSAPPHPALSPAIAEAPARRTRLWQTGASRRQATGETERSPTRHSALATAR